LAFLSAISRLQPFELSKNIGNTPKSSVHVLSVFADGLRSPSAKEKVDTREWKVEFLDQRVLVEFKIYFLPSTFYPLLSTLCEARPCWLGAWPIAALAFRVALPKSSRYSSRASRQITGVLHVPVWPDLPAIDTVESTLRSPQSNVRYDEKERTPQP
jgi:hypothetical protein